MPTFAYTARTLALDASPFTNDPGFDAVVSVLVD